MARYNELIEQVANSRDDVDTAGYDDGGLDTSSDDDWA